MDRVIDNAEKEIAKRLKIERLKPWRGISWRPAATHMAARSPAPCRS